LNKKRKATRKKGPWNKGKRVGSKQPLSRQQIQSLRSRLKATRKLRDLALFNLALDSSLGASDIVQLRVREVAKGGQPLARATVTRISSQRAIQFETVAETREAVAAWIAKAALKPGQYLFPSRNSDSPHISARQYARIVTSWIGAIGLDVRVYSTESLRRTKPMQLYQKSKSLQAAQAQLGHAKIYNTAQYLGVKK
jgi:site-specific recombinase XerD